MGICMRFRIGTYLLNSSSRFESNRTEQEAHSDSHAPSIQSQFTFAHCIYRYACYLSSSLWKNVGIAAADVVVVVPSAYAVDCCRLMVAKAAIAMHNTQPVHTVHIEFILVIFWFRSNQCAAHKIDVKSLAVLGRAFVWLSSHLQAQLLKSTANDDLMLNIHRFSMHLLNFCLFSSHSLYASIFHHYSFVPHIVQFYFLFFIFLSISVFCLGSVLSCGNRTNCHFTLFDHLNFALYVTLCVISPSFASFFRIFFFAAACFSFFLRHFYHQFYVTAFDVCRRHRLLFFSTPFHVNNDFISHQIFIFNIFGISI